MYNDMQITLIREGYAEAELIVSEKVLNGRNVVQGGAIMTLADFAFAGAGNSSGNTVVSLSMNTNFIRPGSGDKLRAVAQKVHHGKKTCVYKVEVFNGDGKLAAEVTITGFNIADYCIYLDEKW